MRNPCGFYAEPAAEPMRNPFGTHAEPMRNSCGAHAEPMRNPCGTHAEPRADRGRSPLWRGFRRRTAVTTRPCLRLATEGKQEGRLLAGFGVAVFLVSRHAGLYRLLCSQRAALMRSASTPGNTGARKTWLRITWVLAE